MKILVAAAALALLFSLGGCIVVPESDGHIHGDGCGHYFWHDGWWDYPHPDGCARCAGVVHVHRDGCGHFFWHDGWWDHPHPMHCPRCVPPAHDHGPGCGHYFWHGDWHGHPHPPGC